MIKKNTIPPRITPCRDDKYMGLAWIIASFSKDPHTQIGSVIVCPESNEPLGWGYNGPPKTINDNIINWDRKFKHDYIIHSEINAMRHSNRAKLIGATLYVTAPPCPKCMLEIIANGIKRIVYFDLKTDANSSINTDMFKKTKHLAKQSKIKLEKFAGNLNWLIEHINSIKNQYENYTTK